MFTVSIRISNLLERKNVEMKLLLIALQETMHRMGISPVQLKAEYGFSQSHKKEV
jgi:hypothetical protein